MNNPPVRILYLIDGLEGDGAERQFCELVRGVHALDEFEVHTGVLEPNDEGHAWMLEERGITVMEFNRRHRFDLGPIKQIVRYIRDNDIQLVHTYMSMGSEFGLIAGKWCDVPVITSSIRNGMNRDWKEAIRTWYQSHLANITVANSMAGLTSRFKTIRDNFRVIHNGFDLERASISDEQREALVTDLGLTGNERLICMAARLEPQKDHRSLIAAMRIVQSTHPKAVALLAGQGELREELEDYSRSIGAERNVRFIGHRRDVESLLSMCEVSTLLTNTDIHQEGISNTIIESMALAVPVIATRGGGTDEILPDSDTGDAPYEFGIKTEAFDVEQIAAAITYLLDNEAERNRIGSNAAAMVRERFNLQRFIEDNVALYSELQDKGAIRERTVKA